MDVEKWLGAITLYEAAQIWDRLNVDCNPNTLVLWSGIGFDQAQRWAGKHGRKTLTQAMGPLMDKSDPICRFNFKDHIQWQRYVHAASILFTLYISNGNEVVVLTPHPPQRLNPYGESYYQNIEEPWLTACCDTATFRIMFSHPKIKDAGDFIYQYWPVDNVDDWTCRFSKAQVKQRWEHRHWDTKQRSQYQPMDLKRERSKLMEKLYLYKTGDSIYWVAASPANTQVGSITTRKHHCANSNNLKPTAPMPRCADISREPSMSKAKSSCPNSKKVSKQKSRQKQAQRNLKIKSQTHSKKAVKKVKKSKKSKSKTKPDPAGPHRHQRTRETSHHPSKSNETKR